MSSTVLVALFVFGLMASVAVHEAGHFVFARRFGMAVSDFSVGFGPPLLTRRRHGIAYRLRLLPLGGFVKIHGMRPSGALPAEPNGVRFVERPAWQRVVVALAGPAANVAFAWVLLFVVAVFVPLLASDADATPMGPVAALAAGTTVLVELGQATIVGFAHALQPAALAEQLSSGYAGEARGGDGVMSIVGAGSLIAAQADGAGVTLAAVLSVVMIVAVINLALALFNLIPLVPLDGGHIVLAVVEGSVSRLRAAVGAVGRWFLPERLVSVATMTGVAVLVGFGLSIIILDIINPVRLPA